MYSVIYGPPQSLLCSYFCWSIGNSLGFFGPSELKFCKYFLRFEEILYIETMASGSRLVLGVLIYLSAFSIYNLQ